MKRGERVSVSGLGQFSSFEVWVWHVPCLADIRLSLESDGSSEYICTTGTEAEALALAIEQATEEPTRWLTGRVGRMRGLSVERVGGQTHIYANFIGGRPLAFDAAQAKTLADTLRAAAAATS